MTTGLPFDDFRDLVRRLPGPDAGARAGVKAGGLGRLDAVAAWLADWTGSAPPRVLRPTVVLFAGSHGVEPGAPHDLKSLMDDCAHGRAPVNRICSAHDLGLKVFDLALDVPTEDFTRDAALDEKGCAATVAFGMEAIAGGIGLLGVRCIGNATSLSASALLAAITGEKAASGELPFNRAVAGALALHGAHLRDPLEALRRVGGRETAAAFGAIVAARMEKVPVVLDGHGALAAAAVLKAMDADAVGHCLVAGAGDSLSQAATAYLGIEALPDFGITAGDGSAAALALGLVKTAAQSHGASESDAGAN